MDERDRHEDRALEDCSVSQLTRSEVGIRASRFQAAAVVEFTIRR
jgi:hypothetical protein